MLAPSGGRVDRATETKMEVIQSSMCWGMPRDTCRPFVPENPSLRGLPACLVPSPVAPAPFYQSPPCWAQPSLPADRMRHRQAFESDPDLGESPVICPDDRSSSTSLTTLATQMNVPTPPVVLVSSQSENRQPTYIPMPVCPPYHNQTFLNPTNYTFWSGNMMQTASQRPTVASCPLWGVQHGFAPAPIVQPVLPLDVGGSVPVKQSAPDVLSHGDQSFLSPKASQSLSSTATRGSSTTTTATTNTTSPFQETEQQLIIEDVESSASAQTKSRGMETATRKESFGHQPQVETLMHPVTSGNVRKAVSDTIHEPGPRPRVSSNDPLSAVQVTTKTPGKSNWVHGQKKTISDHSQSMYSSAWAHGASSREVRRGFANKTTLHSPRRALAPRTPLGAGDPKQTKRHDAAADSTHSVAVTNVMEAGRKLHHQFQPTTLSSARKRNDPKDPKDQNGQKDPKAVVEAAVRFLRSEELHTAVTRWMQIARQRYSRAETEAAKKMDKYISSETSTWSSAPSSETNVVPPSREDIPHVYIPLPRRREFPSWETITARQPVGERPSRQSTGTDTRHFEKHLRRHWPRLAAAPDLPKQQQSYVTVNSHHCLMDTGRVSSPHVVYIVVPNSRADQRRRERRNMAYRRKVKRHPEHRHLHGYPYYRVIHVRDLPSLPVSHRRYSYRDYRSPFTPVKEPDTTQPQYQWPNWMRPNREERYQRPPRRLPGNGTYYELQDGQPDELLVQRVFHRENSSSSLPTRSTESSAKQRGWSHML